MREATEYRVEHQRLPQNKQTAFPLFTLKELKEGYGLGFRFRGLEFVGICAAFWPCLSGLHGNRCCPRGGLHVPAQEQC